MSLAAVDPTGAAAPRVNALGAFVRQRLDDLPMTKSEFARRTHMGRSTVYRLLSDNYAPERMSAARVDLIASALGVDRDALAALWDGQVYAVLDSKREDVVRGFVLATGDLTIEELRHTLDVARAAAGLARVRDAR